jgi:hypothetical protein
MGGENPIGLSTNGPLTETRIDLRRRDARVSHDFLKRFKRPATFNPTAPERVAASVRVKLLDTALAPHIAIETALARNTVGNETANAPAHLPLNLR